MIEVNSFLRKIKTGQNYYVYKQLLNYPNLVNVIDSMGKTPLHWAITREQEEMIDILLNFNPNINARDLFKRTPLDIAKTLENSMIAKKLTDVNENIIPSLEKYKQKLMFEKFGHSKS